MLNGGIRKLLISSSAPLQSRRRSSPAHRPAGQAARVTSRLKHPWMEAGKHLEHLEDQANESIPESDSDQAEEGSRKRTSLIQFLPHPNPWAEPWAHHQLTSISWPLSVGSGEFSTLHLRPTLDIYVGVWAAAAQRGFAAKQQFKVQLGVRLRVSISRRSCWTH